MQEKIQGLKELISNAKSIVAFTGAGISTDSGIPDFRGTQGLYKQSNKYNDPPEYMLSHECLSCEPLKFFDYYKHNMLLKNIKPNYSHLWLAKMESVGKLSAVVTQNIDGLHQDAGNINVFEMHGSIKRNYCSRCNQFYNEAIIERSVDIPHCSCGGIVRPDVVLYGEGLDWELFEEARSTIQEADLVIVLGSSLTVYPAASLIDEYLGDLVIINHDKTPFDFKAKLVINESILETLKQIEYNL